MTALRYRFRVLREATLDEMWEVDVDAPITEADIPRVFADAEFIDQEHDEREEYKVVPQSLERVK